jgi:hypothetical protein
MVAVFAAPQRSSALQYAALASHVAIPPKPIVPDSSKLYE